MAQPNRKSTPLFLGLEIGGTKLQWVLGDAQGRILHSVRDTVARDEDAEGIRRRIESMYGAIPQRERAMGLGVGFGGPIQHDRGRVARSHQVAGWEGFDLAGWLQRLTDLPVAADNDANVAALGEALAGRGRGRDSVFYVTLGSGVGGGLVVGGRIYHGASPGESEVGHIRLNPQGLLVEQRCSGWAVDGQLRAWAARHPDSALARRVRESPGQEARHLAPALAEGDPAAARWLKEVAADLGLALSHVVHLMHPELIVLGGGLSLVGEPLRAAVEHALQGLVMEVFRPGVQVGLAALRENAVPAGALILAGQCLAQGR